jgi:hypothetical protein
LKEEKEPEWSFSHLLSLLNPFSSSTEEEADAHNELMKELMEVRKEVSQEYQWFSGGNSKAEQDSSESLLLSKRKRLLRLFVKDLSSGVCGIVITNKEQRDSMSSEFLKNNRVSALTKSMAWVAVILMNFSLLFYVFLFAMNQTRNRQTAWFQSFVMWAIFEIVVSSTGLVLCIQLLIPLYVFTEVTKVKEKVLKDMLAFRQKYLKLSRQRRPKGAVSTQHQKEGVGFNAAKYLFTSWRLASLFRDIPESGLILDFTSPWPKKKFRSEETTVTSYYEQDVFWAALSRILIFFITPFLHLHTLSQDIITQMVCNTGFGYLCLSFIRLYRISPLLPLAPVVLVFVCVHFLVRSNEGAGKLQKFAIVHPQVGDEEDKEKEVEEEEDDKEEDEEKEKEKQKENLQISQDSKSRILDLEAGVLCPTPEAVMRWDEFVEKQSSSASDSTHSTHPSREGGADDHSNDSANSSVMSSLYGSVYGTGSSRYLGRSEDSESLGDNDSLVNSSESNEESDGRVRRKGRVTDDSISVDQMESDSMSSGSSVVSMDLCNIVVASDPEDKSDGIPEIDLAKWLHGE